MVLSSIFQCMIKVPVRPVDCNDINNPSKINLKIKMKSHVITFDQRFYWKLVNPPKILHKSMAAILPCSVQNFRRIYELKWLLQSYKLPQELGLKHVDIVMNLWFLACYSINHSSLHRLYTNWIWVIWHVMFGFILKPNQPFQTSNAPEDLTWTSLNLATAGDPWGPFY